MNHDPGGIPPGFSVTQEGDCPKCQAYNKKILVPLDGSETRSPSFGAR